MQRPNIRNFVSGLAAGGRYFFASRDAQSALDVSPAAAKLALNRMAKQGSIASPPRRFPSAGSNGWRWAAPSCINRQLSS